MSFALDSFFTKRRVLDYGRLAVSLCSN